MSKNRIFAIATAAVFSAALPAAPGVFAQTTRPDTGVPTVMPDSSTQQTSKQARKAQRKAERKAARAKQRAELGALEKNGYQPGSAEPNYPQDLQDAQRKVNAQKAGGTAPAAAP